MTQHNQNQLSFSNPLKNESLSPINTADELSVDMLGTLIVESFDMGVAAFGKDMEIIKANKRLSEVIYVEPFINESLAKGTDPKIWRDWGQVLNEMIKTSHTGDLRDVRYNMNGREKLLHIRCIPVSENVLYDKMTGLLVIEDVTEREDVERKLAHSERLASVGKVAGKVAHELNNPMDGILRYINLAIRVIEGGDSQKAVEYLRQSRTGLLRMIQIISELLEFSRSSYSAFEYDQVNNVINDAVKAMESHAKQVDINVVSNCRSTPPKVRADSMYQVFCNLIKNAFDAMEGAGNLTITIDDSENKLSIAFHDTGSGIPAENIRDIFKPFFTTKSRQKGTGLGLAICKDIVEKIGGKITVENADEGGSIFTVYLPIRTDIQQEE